MLEMIDALTAAQGSFFVFLGPKQLGAAHTMPQTVESTKLKKLESDEGVSHRVECFGPWTKWQRVQFTGVSHQECINKAYEAFKHSPVLAKRNVEVDPKPKVVTIPAPKTFTESVPVIHPEGEINPKPKVLSTFPLTPKEKAVTPASYEDGVKPVILDEADAGPVTTIFPAKVKNLGPAHDAAVAAGGGTKEEDDDTDE